MIRQLDDKALAQTRRTTFRVFFRSVSKRLNGIVLMAMKFLPFHNQFIADFSAHDEHHDFLVFYIIQGAQISCAQFKLG